MLSKVIPPRSGFCLGFILLTTPFRSPANLNPGDPYDTRSTIITDQAASNSLHVTCASLFCP